MSLLKITGQAGSPLKQLVDRLESSMREGGSEFASQAHAGQVMSLESLNPAELEELNSAALNISETLKTSFEELADNSQSLGFESLEGAPLEAGTMIALAAGSPVDYARAALTNQAESTNGIQVISAESAGTYGSLDFRDTHSLESFDQKELANMLPFSIAFNVQASRQDEFSETFYPTTVVSPENGGIDISVDRTTVHNAIRHQANGKTTDFDQRNLVEAVSDASILADESTALVPFVQDNVEQDDIFLDGVDATYREVAGVDVKTKPLAIGQDIDLLGVSQHPKLVGAGVMDHTDTIDARMGLNNLYLRKGDSGEILRFNVSRLPRNGFLKSVEGSDREMELNFRSEALALNADTTGVDGSEPSYLQSVRDGNYTVRLALDVKGNAQVEYGSVMVYAAPVKVANIEDEDGNRISLTEGAGKTIVSNLNGLQVIGYELLAARTNTNRRTRGLLLNSIRLTERFAIPLGAPISAPSPAGSDRDTRDLDSLIQAARIRNSNNAVTTLLNYADTLRAYVQNRRLGHGHPAIEGTGRHLIVPFFQETNLNIKETINSVKSKERAEDITAVLVNAIRDISYRMYRDSGYQAALDMSSMGGKKPELLVGTDSVIQRHLMVPGDSRTFGAGFESAKVVTSFDSRMDNKIVMTFGRSGGGDGPDPIGFGTHAWIPELASSIMVSRDGATYQEAMVQPRSRHINNLPIMAVINVEGLEDVLTTKVSEDVNVLGDVNLEGFEPPAEEGQP